VRWVGISGSWRLSSEELNRDLIEAVDVVIKRGDGIVSGGALGVDYLATERMMGVEGWEERLKVIIPTSLEVFTEHYLRRADEGVITHGQAEKLLDQLRRVKAGGVLVEMDFEVLDTETYYARNTEVVKSCDELLAFQINGSGGVQDTVEKARAMGKRVELREYKVEEAR